METEKFDGPDLAGTTSMYWAGRSAYWFGLTLEANPWDENNPVEARMNWSWRKGFASARADSFSNVEDQP